jgi:hypothetical protein
VEKRSRAKLRELVLGARAAVFGQVSRATPEFEIAAFSYGFHRLASMRTCEMRRTSNFYPNLVALKFENIVDRAK